ncbi:MAG: hypothetical protein QM817_15980 [Archangium sp.]
MHLWSIAVVLTASLAFAGVGIEQALANGGPEAQLRAGYAVLVVEIVSLDGTSFTNGTPPTGNVVVKEVLRGEGVKVDEAITIRWRPYPHGFDYPAPAEIKKWQASAFEGAPVAGKTVIVIGQITPGHFEVVPRGELKLEKREWVLKQLAASVSKKKK